MMEGNDGALLTLSYLGAVRAMPNYNVMGLAKASLEANVRYMAQSLGPDGIRVNGISAGPIKTLAAAGISNFRRMLEEVENTAPLRRNVTIEQVGNTAAFLCSGFSVSGAAEKRQSEPNSRLGGGAETRSIRRPADRAFEVGRRG